MANNNMPFTSIEHLEERAETLARSLNAMRITGNKNCEISASSAGEISEILRTQSKIMAAAYTIISTSVKSLMRWKLIAYAWASLSFVLAIALIVAIVV